jgi:hypothetical protein
VLAVLSLGLKQPGLETDELEVKNSLSYTSTPPYFLMAWCVIKHIVNIIFTFPFSVS